MRHKKEIQADKMYSLTEVVKDRLLPKKMSYYVLRNIVMDDSALPENKRTINALKVGEGRGRKYFIKGENLLKFIATL